MKSTILFPLITSSILARAAASYSGSPSPPSEAIRVRTSEGVEAGRQAWGCFGGVDGVGGIGVWVGGLGLALLAC